MTHPRSMRKAAIGMLAAGALVLSACGAEVDDTADDPVAEQTGDAATEAGDGATEAGGGGDGEVPTVHFVAFTMDITEMAGQQLVGLETAFEEAGFEYELSTSAPAGAEDHQGMDRILQDIATSAPDYAIVNPASYELVDERLGEIEEAGTVVIVGNIDPNTLEEEPTPDPLTWVAVDEYAMGYNGAEFMAQEYCDEGREDVQVIPFWGPAASEISQDRIGGALDALEEGFAACGIEWSIPVDDIFADFDRERAFNLTETTITAHPDVDLMIGANSNTALGIMESLELQGRLDEVDVMGNGGQLDELAAICRGDIAAAGFRDALGMGMDMGAAVIAHHGGTADDIPEVTLTELPVTHDCETVFEHVPMLMLDTDGFRDNLPEGMWEEYAPQ